MKHTLSALNLDHSGIKLSKNGYIIASAKNLGRLLGSVNITGTRMSRFDGMTDGMGDKKDCTITEATARAYDIIAAGRTGRGIAVYLPDQTTHGKPCISVGDCCYDVDLFFDAPPF